MKGNNMKPFKGYTHTKQAGSTTYRRPTTIRVNYTPSEWTLGFNGFECEHASTTTDTIEHYDHYTEAVTGVPQALSYEPIENCDDCTAYYSTWDEEWYDGGEV